LPDIDPLEQLHLHQPVLKYDSQECYFADSAAEWTNNPGNVLIRTDGSTVRSESDGGELSLGYLGERYPSGAKAQEGDLISDPARDYAEQARKLHEDELYRNRIYGRVTADGSWLQYWFFYFYNDYNLIGDLIKAGLHEGDWEMIQIHLDGRGAPDRAVYAQHAHAGVRTWDQVDVLPGSEQPAASEQAVSGRPIVYVARGSHASYFEPGIKWTGDWFDHADGKRRSPDQVLEIVDEAKPEWSWITWPGHWGDTKKGDVHLPFDSDSPSGPGSHHQWANPDSLDPSIHPELAAPHSPRPAVPSPPHVVSASRAEGAIRLDYQLAQKGPGSEARGLAVTVNSPDETAPPTTHQVEIAAAAGTIDVPHEADPAKRYDLYVSLASAENLASESVRYDLAPVRQTT
jgi:hypothetical protein